MDIFKSVAQLAERVELEARFAATLLQARGPGVVKTPPHKLALTLRDLTAYGPAGAAVALAAASYGDRDAIVDEIGSITFDELERDSNALANALLEKGFQARDGLGIMCRNHRGLWLSIFAGAKLGAATLLLNTDF